MINDAIGDEMGAPGALALAACALLGDGVGTLTAQEPRPSLSAEDGGDDIQALKRQFERQQQQVEQLRQRLAELRKESEPAPASLPPAPPADRGTVEQMVADYLRQRDEARARQEAAERAKAEEDGYRVGSDLRMSTRWNPLNGPTFSTPNKDFVAHLVFWFQYDSVWWSQSASLKSPTQIGDLQDGTFFRRVRPTFDGQAWEVMEWNVILALEQVNNDVLDIDECWVGLMNLPVVGSVRVGKFRVPQGLESGAYSVAKTQTFLEQSAFTDAFYIASPYTPFYLTRGEDGKWLWGRGAWELAARWNHLNLNSGPIQGGQTDALELGVNWHLNSNLKIMFEYLHQDRYQKGTAPNGILGGDVDGFGIRTQFFF